MGQNDYQFQVSVVMATYNRAGLLNRSIESLLLQNFQSLEFILVDDGSTDSTYEVVDPYVLKYDFFKYNKHSNRKQPASLNVGIQSARGKYITFLDSDDEYLENHLQLRYDYLEKNTDIDLIHGGLQVIGNEYVPDKNDLTRMIHIDECVAGGTIFAKQTVFRKLDGFQTLPFASDSDFVARAKLANMKVERVGFKTYRYYRDTEDGICNTIS